MSAIPIPMTAPAPGAESAAADKALLVGALREAARGVSRRERAALHHGFAREWASLVETAPSSHGRTALLANPDSLSRRGLGLLAELARAATGEAPRKTAPRHKPGSGGVRKSDRGAGHGAPGGAVSAPGRPHVHHPQVHRPRGDGEPAPMGLAPSRARGADASSHPQGGSR